VPHHDVAGPDVAGWVLAVAVVLPALAYARAVRVRRALGRRWPRWRTVAFVAGLVVAAAVISPPGRALAHGDDMTHMAGHLLLGMIAPISVVLAAPGTLLLGALPLAARRPAATVLRSGALHVLTHPVVAAVLDIGGLAVLFLTPLVDVAAADPLVGHLVDLHVLLAGCLFTWSLIGPDPAPRRPSVATRAVVLVLAGAAHGYLAKLLLVRGDVPAGAAELMYYGGDVVEILLAAALFGAWYRGRRGLRPRSGRRCRHSRRPVPAVS
jgi:putative membrane protein